MARAGLALVALGLGVATLGLALPAAAQQSGTGSIALTSQDAWVQSSSTPIRVGLKVQSSVPASDLVVGVALYTEPGGSPLASRDEFDATLKGQFAGLDQQFVSTLSLDSLAAGNGAVTLYAGGSGLPGKVPKSAATGQVVQLPCVEGCDGVYPLQVSLVDTLTGTTLDSFTTYLIVAPPAVAPERQLRFSFVLPVGAAPALTPGGTSAVPPQTVSRIDTVVSMAASWPGAPLTVEVYGQTLLGLSRSHHASLVGALASGGAGTLVPGPFSAVDPTALAQAGLGSELALQLEQGRLVFASEVHESDASPVYVATAPLGSSGLAALAADGLKRIVLPAANLSSVANGNPKTVQWPYTLSAPFHIAGSSVEGVQADSGLEAHLTGSGSSALRAQQLLADLAEIYFDSPNYPQSRGVALVAPGSWAPQPGFLDAVLSGLQSSPIIAAVPISELFRSVPPGTCKEAPSAITGCSPAVRSIAAPNPNSGGGITFGEVQTARAEIGELASIMPTATATTRIFDDAVLLAESAGLDPGVRESYLSASLATTTELGSELSMPANRIVTVTASSARFPIAVSSSSSTPLHVVLVISGPKLTSPSSTPLVLDRGTTAFIVRVTTRTSGDSNLQLELLSPTGGFVLVRREFTLRSTAISGVAIGLTAGAGAFLLVWWLRSALRRGRRRSGKHARGERREPATEPVPEPAS